MQIILNKFFYSLVLIISFLVLLSFIGKKHTLKKETFIGKVVAITDGDTFKFLKKDSTLIKVRLANIDCPEKKQPFSKKAKQFVSNTIFNKTVTVHVLKRDRYQRYIANVIYGDSLNLSYELVKQGLAWHYKKYSKDTILQSLEDNAKLNRVGLWVDENAIAPWVWRGNKKKAVKQ
ncbi:thermonuclease family protein [Flavivirga abyssicola]|uniref:thermonuclease family protein n=1 Tax=Flavivirga abyssicola TaxID=3063533 RepID=UPI0026DFB9D2|nr:thermonuclease family protein [Flavivirga sp. MEBiC07777]WVK14288.1 thermonuclease family protein [Flavivirga sp. MEBiC07777]